MISVLLSNGMKFKLVGYYMQYLSYKLAIISSNFHSCFTFFTCIFIILYALLPMFMLNQFLLLEVKNETIYFLLMCSCEPHYRPALLKRFFPSFGFSFSFHKIS